MVDWFYGQIVGFLGNFFALMGNMGVELFELEWVSAIILFFSRLAWALFTVSVVVCAFECGIEYSAGRGNLQQCGMNIIKGFLAVSLFTVVPRPALCLIGVAAGNLFCGSHRLRTEHR